MIGDLARVLWNVLRGKGPLTPPIIGEPPGIGEIPLNGGHTTTDPRLDRLPEFDERSREFPIRGAVPAKVRGRTWKCAVRLDQGSEGACTGFSAAYELASEPVPIHGLTEGYARSLYYENRTRDEWPGEGYEGSSVLASAKTLKARGFISEYRWAFGIDDVVLALSQAGGVMLGTDWMPSMFDTRPSGLIEVDLSGKAAGGHAYYARGFLPAPRLKGEGRKLGPVVRCVNSWGERWGAGGEFYILVEDLARLLDRDGDACVPMGRRKAPLGLASR